MSTAQQRPSKREIDQRLKEAKTAIAQGRVFFANYAKAEGELETLNIVPSNDVWQLISLLFDEIELGDYAGGHPPQKSYEPEIANIELWAFAWDSSILNMKVYLKFAIRRGYFYYVSLHESKSHLDKDKNELFKMR